MVMLRRILSDKELVKLNAYRLVILLVAADVVQLFMHILSGIYMLCQSSFEPVSDQVTGAIITSAYVFYTLISLLLAFNRLVQVTSRSYYEMLFGNAGMAVQCGICVAISVLFLAILSSPLACIHYDVALWTWIYDKRFWWSSDVERIEMYIELFCYSAGGVMYFVSFVAIIYKRSVYADVRRKGPERRFLFQAAGITVFMLLFNFFWHEYDLIFPGSKYGYMAVNSIWILSCAMNAIAFYYVHGTSVGDLAREMLLIRRRKTKVQKAKNEHFRWSIALLGSTGLLCKSANNGRRLKRYARRILAVSLLLLVIVQPTYELVATLVTGGRFFSALFEWLTAMRPFVSLVFFVYWEVCGKLQLLLRELRGHVVEEYMEGARPCDRWTAAFFAVVVNVRNVLFSVVLVILTLTVSDQAGDYLRLRGLMYGFGGGFIIPVAVQAYASYAADAILCFQVVITLSMRSAFEQFNLRLKRIKYATFDEAAKTLRSAMNHHIMLLETLDLVDDVFSDQPSLTRSAWHYYEVRMGIGAAAADASRL
ncbi:Protein SRT-62 [Aphelenchoides avenae]|nr:Protein SRT-62 [Aphelenchus avenae]